MIKIDGGLKSGSGTILRYALSLACLVKEDLEIINIRKKRSNPGLRPQHLKAVEAVKTIVSGKLSGAQVGSTSISFSAGNSIKSGNYRFRIGTAGSTTMLAMTVLPLVIFADDISLIRIEGGLFQDFAPSAYHMQHVLFPILKKMGIDLQLRIIRPGYVPTGEGIIELKVHPVKSHIDSISLTNQGKLMKIRGYALSSHLKPQRVSERMANSALKYLKDLSEDIHIETCYDETAKQKGAALAIFAYTDTGCILGSDLAGAPGRTSEEIGKKVALELIKDIKTNATVDRYLADQLILYAGLAKGKTEYFIPFMTEHIESNLWLIQEILGAKVYLDNLKLTIEGIGYKHS